MRWLRYPSSTKLHAEVDGVILCHPDGLSGDPVEVQDAAHEDRCQNCDSQWRHRGRLSKPKRVHPKGSTKVKYIPRFKFKDFE